MRTSLSAPLSLVLITGAAFAAATFTAGAASAATPAPQAAHAAAADPYSPAYQHSYRHGAIPTIQQSTKMNAWAAAQAAPQVATGPETLSYGGGISGVGVLDGHAKVYLVFYGTQWGSQGTDSNGNLTFSGDPAGGAPVAQQMFKGIGTGNELWSADLTQWCDGPGVAVGATSCPAGASFIPYQSGGVLAGVWYDNTTQSPPDATGHQLGQEAVNAAGHFGNTTAAANRDAYYVILSPHGTDPDNYQGEYCAWHDYNGDSNLSGGPVTSPYGDIAFSNQPYNMDTGADCGVGFINNPGTLDGYTITMGHEWHETMSDEYPAGGWTNNTGSSYTGEEDSDECAWLPPGSAGGIADVTMGNGTYAEQASWSNDTNACSISHPIVGGQPSSSIRAIHGPNGDLWAGAAGGTDLGLPMKAGTSPSIATLSTGGKEIAYQGSNGDLWVTALGGPAYDSHLGIMSGTNPAVAAAASGGFNVAFQANTGVLWDYTSATGRGTSLGQGMVTTSSPSITAPVGAVGGYEIAYQGSNVDLWVTTISGAPIDSHLGMMSGTSPAIAAASSGGFNAAFQANTGVLWDYTSATGRGASLGQGMVTTTSPSITAPVGAVGGYEIAYQGSNVDLWVTTISGTPIDSHLGMMNGTNPDIAAAPGSGFNAAFQANTGYLWDYTSTTGRGTSLNQAMTSGTSPGLAQ